MSVNLNIGGLTFSKSVFVLCTEDTKVKEYITISCTLQPTGNSITSLIGDLYVEDGETRVKLCNAFSVTSTIAAGPTMPYRWGFLPERTDGNSDYDDLFAKRALKVVLEITATDSEGNVEVIIPDIQLRLVNKLYKPKIHIATFDRHINGVASLDSSEVMCSLKVSLDCSDGVDTDVSGFYLTISWYDTENVLQSITKYGTDGVLQTALSDGGLMNSTTLITDEFDRNYAYSITVWFGDYGESASTTIVVPRSFANVHLSGASTGGVAIGGFSTSEENDPKFECHYPAFFYGDVTFSNDDIILPEVSETDNGKVLMVVEGKWSLGIKGSSGVSPASAFKSINADMFAGYTEIESVDLPEATTLNHRAFQNCTGLKTVNLPVATTFGVNVFQGCTSLEKADLGAITALPNYTFTNCSSLQTLILRTDALVTITTYVFTGSGVANKTGYVYVPASLVDSYKANNVWKTYASQIRAIEDYPEITS